MSSIDWLQLITKEMKDAANRAQHLSDMKAALAARNGVAAATILRIQDRIDTLGYGIDLGEATEADEVEQAALLVSIAAWKNYKFALGKVTKQPTWPAAPAWPVEPAQTVIDADPQARTDETI
ncbi:phage tail protein [Pseudomonas sp. JV414]|uniref:phage tail protein n=1 Tax=Pseudomonas sp. JV414 TaxID=1733110 RepID=UPI0028E11EBC|nr:phage tail protein [Pseudomonas sp. JV414]MDT9673832.1 phage tail protein [Pseudomonas sp. JV414]